MERSKRGLTQYFEEARKIPIVQETDVLVIGGGVAGVGAALAAARSGKQVTLIEKSIVLGGLATLGHVCIYLALCDGYGHKIFGGIAEELLHVSIKYGYNTLPKEWKYGTTFVENPSGRYRTHFNIPAFILALDELMEKEGIQVVYDTVFSMPIMEGDLCKGIIVENKSGRTAYLAKVIVDATGDADVIYRAGGECIEQRSIVSHWCYELELSNFKEAMEKNDILKAIKLRWLGLRPDADNTKSEIPKFLGTSSKEVNEYIRVSRKLALDYLKKNQRPDYAMLTMPFMPQFRTTRRIKGVQEFKMIAGAYVESSVGCVCNSLGLTSPVYEFPYEAMIDPKLKNIIAAGRIVAAGGEAWEVMRLIPACVLTGEVAGTAAAISIDDGVNLQQLDIKKLQERLSKNGIMIHMPEELKANKRTVANTDPKKIQDPLVAADALSYH